MFRRTLLTFFALTLFAYPSFSASTDNKAALVKKLISIMEVDKQIEMMNQHFAKMMPNPFAKEFGPDQAKFDSVYTTAVKKEMDTTMKKFMDAVMPKISEIYGKDFTEDELKKIIEFQESPAGKKMKDMTPKIMQETMNLVQTMIQKDVMPNFEKAILKGLEEAKKQGINPTKVDELIKKHEEKQKKMKEMMENLKKQNDGQESPTSDEKVESPALPQKTGG